MRAVNITQLLHEPEAKRRMQLIVYRHTGVHGLNVWCSIELYPRIAKSVLEKLLEALAFLHSNGSYTLHNHLQNTRYGDELTDLR